MGQVAQSMQIIMPPEVVPLAAVNPRPVDPLPQQVVIHPLHLVVAPLRLVAALPQ